MTTVLAEKLADVRDFRKILETTVKELGESYGADLSQILLSNPLDRNITAICEYLANPDDKLPAGLKIATIPLSLQGGGLGQVSMARSSAFSEDEINQIRITLAEISNVVRYAQINDLVQRDTFRSAFMSEINNVMNYSMGLGDALFMVVNILGKVLAASRCLFICVDDSRSDWKCYEYWQREKLASAQEFGWPTTDSAVISQALLAKTPQLIYEGQDNSYLTPVQEELQLLGIRSLLAIPIRSGNTTHGCIVVQMCDSRHAFTRGEIDMVQNVSDTVAKALDKIPEAKKEQEPIMRLHQRSVEDRGAKKESMQAVRQALKGALGKTAIPKAQRGAQPNVGAAPAAKPDTGKANTGSSAMEGLADVIVQDAASKESPQSGKSLNKVLGSFGLGAPAKGHRPGPGAHVSFDAVDEQQPEQPSQQPVPPSEQPGTEAKKSKWGDLDAIPTPGTNKQLQTDSKWSAPDTAGTAEPSSQSVEADDQSTMPQSKWEGLDTIAAPNTEAAESAAWGNLDAIPTPAATPQPKGGLGSTMKSKAKTASLSAQPSAMGLGTSFHKERAKAAQPIHIDGPPIEIDEREAEAKLQEILASTNPLSDFIYATNNVSPRILGRIDGWISEVEQKDKYANGHARQVAEYAVAIARLLGLSEEEIKNIRLAAILHDVGKLGLRQEILQKPDEDLTDHELLLVMKHSIDGAELVKQFPELEHLSEIILYHHEEYDGNGYPAGIMEEEIPLASRIICVANGYHIMVSDLTYRAGMNPEQAQQQMRAAAGKAYDPNIVDALLACISQGLVAAKIN